MRRLNSRLLCAEFSSRPMAVRAGVHARLPHRAFSPRVPAGDRCALASPIPCPPPLALRMPALLASESIPPGDQPDAPPRPGECVLPVRLMAGACMRACSCSFERKAPRFHRAGPCRCGPFCFSFLRGGVLLSLPLIDQTTVFVRKAFRGPVRPPVVRPRPGLSHVPARKNSPCTFLRMRLLFLSLLLSLFLAPGRDSHLSVCSRPGSLLTSPFPALSSSVARCGFPP